MSGHRIPNDEARVNVNDDCEVDYWTEKLGCSAGELREAVSAVGVEVENVRMHLAQTAS